MTVVRKLTAADAAGFWEIRLEALLDAPGAFATSVEEHRLVTLSTTAERLTERPDGSCAAGAFLDGQLASIAGLARETQEKRRHKAMLWGVYARPQARGKGLGRAVVAYLLEQARLAAGLQRVYLRVSSHNDAARALYKSCGFVRYGVEDAALIVNGTPVNEDLMELVLR